MSERLSFDIQMPVGGDRVVENVAGKSRLGRRLAVFVKPPGGAFRQDSGDGICIAFGDRKFIVRRQKLEARKRKRQIAWKADGSPLKGLVTFLPTINLSG